MKSLSLILFVLLFLVQCKKSETAPVPVLSSSLISQAEGNGGTSSFIFNFSLSVASSETVTVTVKTVEGSAKAGEDFTAVDQLLEFKPGETTKQLTVVVVADDIREGRDDFSITLTNAKGCTLQASSYQGLINNDDTKIAITDAGYTSPLTYPGLTMTWSDEFSGAALNTGDWNYEIGDGCPNCGWGNNELEYYTNGDNVYLQSGKLFIEARVEVIGGKGFTSSRITTKNKKFFKFGRIDIRAKVPIGQGIWPALWMMPQENKYGGWPSSGEIDMMELLGHEPTKVYSTVHYGPGPGSQNISRNKIAASPYSNEFHVYSMIWEQDKMQFLVDDVLFSTVNKPDIGGNTYPFNETFFFIFNLAVGGNWPGSPDASTYFPQWLAVDYVRVFQ
jgi:Glycosyl hydrolases family 16/Calx-beta domain